MSLTKTCPTCNGRTAFGFDCAQCHGAGVIAVENERCAYVHKPTAQRCELVDGHDGPHRSSELVEYSPQEHVCGRRWKQGPVIVSCVQETAHIGSCVSFDGHCLERDPPVEVKPSEHAFDALNYSAGPKPRGLDVLFEPPEPSFPQKVEGSFVSERYSSGGTRDQRGDHDMARKLRELRACDHVQSTVHFETFARLFEDENGRLRHVDSICANCGAYHVAGEGFRRPRGQR